MHVEYDGVTLVDLLVYDEQARGVRPTNFKLHTFTPVQRAAVDGYRAAAPARNLTSTVTPNLDAIRRVTSAAESAESEPLRAFWAIAHAMVYVAGKLRIPSAEMEVVASLVEGSIIAQRAREN